MEAAIVIVLFFCAASGAFTSTVATSKGYSGGLWFFLGFIFPGISLLAIGFCENAIVEDEIEVTQGFKGKYYKKCSACHSIIPIQSTLCNQCEIKKIGGLPNNSQMPPQPDDATNYISELQLSMLPKNTQESIRFLKANGFKIKYDEGNNPTRTIYTISKGGINQIIYSDQDLIKIAERIINK